jgi:hypothetical protein
VTFTVKEKYVNLQQHVDSLTDTQAEHCLKGVLKGLAETDEGARALFSFRPEQFVEVVQGTAAGVGKPVVPVKEPPPEARGRAARRVLEHFAGDERLAPRVESWLASNRPVLLEPVTTALILAGIVTALSLDIEVSYEVDNGKKKTRVVVKKKPTVASILDKFWDLFS